MTTPYKVFNTAFDRITNGSGSPLSGAECHVYLYNTLTRANIYQTPAGTAQSNPVVADSQGLLRPFYRDPSIRMRAIYTLSGGNPANAGERLKEIVDVDSLAIEGYMLDDLSNVDMTDPEKQTFRDYLGFRSREVDPLDHGATGDGVADDYIGLSDAITAAQATGYDVLISTPIRVGTSITIPVDIAVSFVGVGMLLPDVGVTITWLGRINSDPVQRFDITSGGVVDFGSNSQVTYLYFEWWGPPVRGDGDAQPALQAVVDSVPSRCEILCASAKRYDLFSSVVIHSSASRSVKIRSQRSTGLGGEFEGTYFWWMGANNGTMFDCRSCRSMVLEGLVWLYSDGVTVGANNAVKMSTPVPADGITSSNIIRDCGAYGFSANSSLRVFSVEGTSGSNGEFMIFERVGAYHFTGEAAGSRTGVGFYNEETSTNAHGHILRDCRWQGFGAGVKGAMGLSFEGLNGFNANDVDILCINATQSLIIENCNSENGRAFFKLDTLNAAGPIVIRSNRIENVTPAAASTMVFIGASRVHISDNKMNDPAGPGTGHFYDFTSSTNAAVTLENNDYRNIGGTSPTTPLLGTPLTLISLNDLYGTSYSNRANNAVAFTIGPPIIQNRGADASAATVVQDGAFQLVSGSPAIATITPDANIAAQMATTYGLGTAKKCFEITLFGASGFTTTAAGNIAKAMTVPAGNALKLIYDLDTNKWYPVM